MYSIGLPPEFIGMKILDQLTEREWDLLERYYVKMEYDLNVAGEYVSWKNINMFTEMSAETAKRANMNEETAKNALSNLLNDVKTVEDKLKVNVGPRGFAQRRYENFTNNFLVSFLQGEDAEARKALTESAKLRKCLG